jgi:hypothetical protein
MMPPAPYFPARNRRGRHTMPAPPPLPVPDLCIDEERRTLYMQTFLLYRLWPFEGRFTERTSDREKQAVLLKMLAVDIKTREAFDGSAYGIRANFRSFASTIPHQTISAVLSYMGVSEEWLGIFKRFLGAPLNMAPVVRGGLDKVRTRSSGMPIGHGFERVFGEVVLFCLDFAVRNRTASEQTTPYLLRLRDESFFVGKQQQCEQVQEQIETFAKVMGLDVSVEDLFPREPGLGKRKFNKEDKITLSIDKSRVTAYAGRIKKQLAACPTIFAWVSLWNRTIGTYASHLFGPLVNVFGKSHLKAVKTAYNVMYEVIFGGDCNLTQHVINLLPFPFPPGDPSFSAEAWVHLPATYGGLGVQSPYLWLNGDGSDLVVDPETPFKDYLEREETYYWEVRAVFEGLTTKQREEKLKGIFDGDEDRVKDVFGSNWKATTTMFPTLEELTAHRERSSHQDYQSVLYGPQNYPYNHPYYVSPALAPPPDPLTTYRVLASSTYPSESSAPPKFLGDMRTLADKPGMDGWRQATIEDKWALELYGEECFGRFGGLEIWYRDGVPRELLKVLRGEGNSREMY